MKSGCVGRLTLKLLFLVALASSHTAPPVVRAQGGTVRRVNVPYFSGEVRFDETAIFWFGRVTPTENHADVRVGYNDDQLYLRVGIFDRRLWYDTTPSPGDLTAWDAVTLYLDLDGNVGGGPDANAYRFIGQLDWWEPRDNYQAVYQGDGSGWGRVTIPFTTSSGWRGDAPNDDTDDRGWRLTFRIPFASVGLSGPPSRGTIWGVAAVLSDRDDAAGTVIPEQTWPEAMDPNRPATWGQLAFGLPTYTAPLAVPRATVTIRHKLGGAEVIDGAVGGGSTCGEGLDFWTEWGKANYAGQGDFNIQNQADVADWPCFSKYYVTFPLDVLPRGKDIISATLTLHQFGNAGGGSWGEPAPSLIQVCTVAENWEEATLTWNSAPLAVENISATWVDPLAGFPGWPGVPRTWDVSRAVAEAHSAEQPLRLALYSADSAYHSGKYFVSSDTGDWNAEGRPTLTVVWGQPMATVDKRVCPAAPTSGEVVTYTMVVVGSGYPLILTDTMPDGLSDPGPVKVTSGSAAYSAARRLVTWHGTPAVQQPVTVSFSATVQIGGPVALINIATLTDATIGTRTDTAVVIVDGLRVYLPLVVK